MNAVLPFATSQSWYRKQGKNAKANKQRTERRREIQRQTISNDLDTYIGKPITVAQSNYLQKEPLSENIKCLEKKIDANTNATRRAYLSGILEVGKYLQNTFPIIITQYCLTILREAARTKGRKLKVDEFPDLVAILEYEFGEGDRRERGGGGLESHTKLHNEILYRAADSKTKMKDAREAIIALAPEDFSIY